MASAALCACHVFNIAPTMKHVFLSFFSVLVSCMNLSGQINYAMEYDNNAIEAEGLGVILPISSEEAVILTSGPLVDTLITSWSLINRRINLGSGQLIERYHFNDSDTTSMIINNGIVHNDELLSTGSISREHSFLNTDYTDAFIASHTKTGELNWIKTYGVLDYNRAHEWDISIAPSPLGGYTLCGRKIDVNSSNYPWYGGVWRIASDGELLWERDIKLIEGEDEDQLYPLSVVHDDSGNIYVLSQARYHLYVFDLMVTKFSATGDLLWSKVYDMGGDAQPEDMVTTADGNLMVSVGISYEAYNSIVPALVKIDTSGTILWEEEYYDELGGIGTWAGPLVRTMEGGFAMLTAFYYDHPVLIVTDSLGQATTVEIYSDLLGYCYPEDIKQLPDASFLLLGQYTPFSGPSATSTTWLVRTNPIGEVVSASAWAKPQNSYRVYPNPVRGPLSFESEAPSESARLKIYNESGALVHQAEINGQYVWDTDQLPSGFYLYKISQSGAPLQVGKVIVD
jgi:hypothetical protein